jgi:hypothetical protein
MTVSQSEAAGRNFVSLRRSLSCWDPDSECTIVFAQPAIEPELWVDYVRGACQSYRSQGVEKALDMDALHSGADTALFAACVNDAGRVVGGLRARGPYQSADECHALLEWSGQPGQDAVRKMVTDRLPFGVVEMKTAWVTDDSDRRHALAEALARTAFPTMALLEVQFLMATAASHVLGLWRSSGGVVAAKIPATPYPDERYRTKMMWWDRRTFANHAEPKQLSKILNGMAELDEILSDRDGVLARGGSRV